MLACSPAFAAPVRVIPCAPPLDRPLRLIVTQHIWLADGTPATVTVTRDMRFVRDTDGVAVEAQIHALSTDQKGAAGTSARARLIMAYGAPGEVRTRIRLDAAMAIRGVDSLDSVWQDFRHRQTRLDAAMTRGGKSNARTDAMVRTLDAMGDAEKVAILSGFLVPVLRYCGAIAPTGTKQTADGVLHVDSRTDSGVVSDVGHYAIDNRTGLLRSLERSLSTADTPVRPLREEWILQSE